VRFGALFSGLAASALLMVGVSCARAGASPKNDGAISLRDYQTAFEKFESCVAGAGDKVVRKSVDPLNGIVSYVVEHSGNRPAPMSDRCLEEFKDVDARYARLHPPAESELVAEQLAFFRSMIAPCLVANGVDFVMPTSIGTPEWSRLNDKFFLLNTEGKCPLSSPGTP
jgi:hypothetical protein